MRMVYLDESGISANEPYLVVAGIVVHADKQWKALERYLHDMRDALIPVADRKDYIFHATDLFHGTKKFHRDRWPKEERWKILDELVSIPAQFDLPLVCGFVRKAEFRDRAEKISRSARDLQINGQAVAFNLCAFAVQRYMQAAAQPDEVALLIAEDNKEARAQVRRLITFCRNPAFELLTEDIGAHLPLSRIVDTAHFAEKMDSSPLQVADACAFSIMRRLRRAADSDRFYKPLAPNLVATPNLEALDLIDPFSAA